MSFVKTVRIGDGANLDAFSRLRVSDPVSLYDMQMQYDLAPLRWESAIVAGGSIAHTPNNSAATLTVNGANGAQITFQSRNYFRYFPGRSQMIAMTFTMGAAVANVRRRVGYFDDNDGVFLEQNGVTDVALVQRTSTSGAPSDAVRILQDNWNLDTLKGTGPSGLTLDLSKAQILFIDAQWLGVGRVRVGFDLNGQIIYVHEFLNANSVTVPYTKTFNLPLRYQMTNTAASAGATFLAICQNVSSEGGTYDDLGIPVAIAGTANINITARRAVLTVRPKLTFNGIVNRIRNILEAITAYADGSILAEVVYSPTLSGTPTWTDVNTNYSGMEYSVHGDAAAGAFTGGLVIWNGFLGVGGGVAEEALSGGIGSKLPWGLDLAGAVSLPISLVLTPVSGTVATRGGMHWREVR